MTRFGAVAFLLLIGSAAAATEEVTLDNFRVKLASHPLMAKISLTHFKCDPDRDLERIVCFTTVHLQDEGASLAFEADERSRVVRYVSLMNPNPMAAIERRRPMLVALYMNMISILSSTFSPEQHAKERMDMLIELQKNTDRRPNERKVGPWVYSAGKFGPTQLQFTVERK
jgi:hypothetical protein